MRFLTKLAFIFNSCFIVSVILRLVEIANQKKGKFDGVIGFQPLESTLVVLGYSAIFVNILFAILFFVRFSSKRMNNLSRFLVFFNLILLPAQVYYFFFSKF